MDKGSEFDIYHKWLGIPPRYQPPNHYRLLGVEEFESDPEVIQSAAARQIAHVQTFRIGPQSELSQKLLNEIARAKVCLLNPQSKQLYDRDLKALTPPSTRPLEDGLRVLDSGSSISSPLGKSAKERPPSIEEETFEPWPIHKPRRHTAWLGKRSRYAISGVGVALLIVTLIVAWSQYIKQGGAPSATTHPTTLAPEQREWRNQTYGTTIRHRQGNEWIEYDNGTNTQRLKYKETGRTPQYIYLSCPERNQELRLQLQGSRFELKRNGVWGWVATGRWATADRELSTLPKAGAILYLSDLKETSFEVWKYRPWFGFDKNGKFVDSEDRLEKKIVIGGKEYPKGIFLHPKSNGISKVSYSLTGLPHYRYFEATVGVCDARRYGPHTPLLFEVWGDGALLWQSEPVKQWGQPQPCNVTLPKISQLELLVRCRGDAAFAFAVWGDPRLTSVAGR